MDVWLSVVYDNFPEIAVEFSAKTRTLPKELAQFCLSVADPITPRLTGELADTAMVIDHSTEGGDGASVIWPATSPQGDFYAWYVNYGTVSQAAQPFATTAEEATYYECERRLNELAAWGSIF